MADASPNNEQRRGALAPISGKKHQKKELWKDEQLCN
jgi:hypothetical protein